MWLFEVLDKLKSVNIQEMFIKRLYAYNLFIVNTNSKKKLDIVKFLNSKGNKTSFSVLFFTITTI